MTSKKHSLDQFNHSKQNYINGLEAYLEFIIYITVQVYAKIGTYVYKNVVNTLQYTATRLDQNLCLNLPQRMDE